MDTPIPVLRIILDSIQFVWNKKSRMLRALLIPSAAIFILQSSTQLTHLISSDPGFSGHALFGWFSFLIQAALYALFAITCHRLALIGNDSVPDYGLLTWTKREWRYLGWFFVIMILFMLYSFVINSLHISIITSDVEAGASVDSFRTTRILLNLLYIPLLYILCRLSVLYPAIALDQPVTAQWAWRLTVHNGWGLTLIVAVLPGALYFLGNFLSRENATFVESIILSLIGFILLAVEIVALSFSYKHLTANKEPVPRI
jgi:hypothetical protein